MHMTPNRSNHSGRTKCGLLSAMPQTAPDILVTRVIGPTISASPALYPPPLCLTFVHSFPFIFSHHTEEKCTPAHPLAYDHSPNVQNSVRTHSYIQRNPFQQSAVLPGHSIPSQPPVPSSRWRLSTPRHRYSYSHTQLPAVQQRQRGVRRE